MQFVVPLMRILVITKAYLMWHYTQGVADLWDVLGNLLRFIYSFFSIGLLFRTLFARWRRLGEEKPDHLDLKKWATAIVVNTIMRIVGVFVRLFVLIMGLIVLLLTFFAGVVAFVLWFVLPFIAIGLVILGLELIFIGV